MTLSHELEEIEENERLRTGKPFFPKLHASDAKEPENF